MKTQLLNDGWMMTRSAGIAGLFGGQAPEPIRLPHDATISQERTPNAASGADKGYYPDGAVTLERVIEVTDPTESMILELDGVHANSSVFVNGQFVSERPNGYARQFANLSPALTTGRNSVKVVARSRKDSRWYTGLGAHRNAYLHTGGPVYIEPCSIIVLPHQAGTSARLTVSASIANRRTEPTEAEVRITIFDGLTEQVTVQSRLELPPGVTSLTREVVVDAPHLWTLDDPNRYSCRVDLELPDESADVDSTMFGIRYVTLDPEGGLLLNGESVKLRGACVHHDHGPLGAASFERAEERRVELLKAAGFNAIRSAHNSASEGLLNACDRLGMLVMDEFTDVWHTPKTPDDYSEAFEEWWERDLTDLVLKAANHPSVIMLSVGNEIPETGDFHGEQTARRLTDLVRRIDDTRLVTLALNGLFVYTAGPGATQTADTANAAAGMDVNALMANFDAMMSQMAQAPIVDEVISPVADLLDVAGYNYMDARYELDLAKHPDRYILGTESYPKAIGKIWPIIEANPRLIGDFTWTGWDYIGEAGVGKIDYRDDSGPMYASFPWSLAYCGDFDMTGHRRPASYYREIAFGLRKDPYPVVIDPRRAGAIPRTLPWSWTDAHPTWAWPIEPGAPVRVDVYSDADAVELILNGESLGVNRVGIGLPLQATFTVPYAPGELVAVNHRNGVVAERTSLRSAGPDTRVLATVDRAIVTDDPGDLCYVDISITDAAGTVRMDADRELTVTADGPAVLQALATADPMDITNFSATARRTHQGRAQAILRPTGDSGRVTVRITTEHGEVAEVAFDVAPTEEAGWRDISPLGTDLEAGALTR